MNSALCMWLADLEDRFLRMTTGVLHFAFHWLPSWVLRTLLETVGPAVVRMIRVLVALCLWLAVLFSPAAAAIAFRAPFWVDLGGVAWLAMAIAGSVYGLYRVVKKRRAKTVAPAAVPVAAVPGLKAPVACVLPAS